jgi:hypothetical protein
MLDIAEHSAYGQRWLVTPSLASIYWLGRNSDATLASPQSDQSSELDGHAAVCVACGLIVWTPRA